MGILRLCFYELSALLEAWLLRVLQHGGVSLVKASPTLRPQGMLSKRRLRQVLNEVREASPTVLIWREREGHIIEVGEALIAFYSANEAANVVGATAHPLLEVDEAQEVDTAEVFARFSPNGGEYERDDSAVWDGVDGRDAAGAAAAESGTGGAGGPIGGDAARGAGAEQAAL